MAASTQGQALAALLLYRDVVGRPLAGLGEVVRARAPVRLPVGLTRAEVERVLAGLRGTMGLVGAVLYGSGLRLLESLTLRVKDVDLECGELRIRRGKGARDRVTVLARTARGPLVLDRGYVINFGAGNGAFVVQGPSGDRLSGYYWDDQRSPLMTLMRWLPTALAVPLSQLPVLVNYLLVDVSVRRVRPE